MKNVKTMVIVLAAGTGKRLGARCSKPFVVIRGRPLIVRTLQSLYAGFSGADTVVTCNAKEIPWMRSLLDSQGYRHVRIVAGGDCRAASLSNVLESSSASRYDFIAVHDGARPFVTRRLIRALYTGIGKHCGCIPVLPVRYTIKMLCAGIRLKTLPRDTLLEVQTPQLFRSASLLRAYRHCLKKKIALESLYDDSQMVERAGGTVKTVPGDHMNIKVTYPLDLHIANVFLRTGTKALNEKGK